MPNSTLNNDESPAEFCPIAGAQLNPLPIETQSIGGSRVVVLIGCDDTLEKIDQGFGVIVE
jgi:hypothetical protein